MAGAWPAWLVGAAPLSVADWLALAAHFLMLSLLAIGGAITTVPEMQRFVVREHHWLSDAQFTASVALAQAAPGPNVLFVAVIGYNLGGLAGVAATMVGTLLPSSTLAMAVTHWGDRHREALALRAFTTGMAPITIGLLLATSWVLLAPTHAAGAPWHMVLATSLLVAATLVWMLRTRGSPLWPIAVGAVAGALGCV